VVVTGITATGEREVLACAVGDTDTEVFWTETLRSPRTRGMAGVRLVISDHHDGLKDAIAKCFVGVGWQRSSGCTSCATSWPRSPRRTATWSPPPSHDLRSAHR
jgi:hypothetical protein